MRSDLRRDPDPRITGLYRHAPCGATPHLGMGTDSDVSSLANPSLAPGRDGVATGRWCEKGFLHQPFTHNSDAALSI